MHTVSTKRCHPLRSPAHSRRSRPTRLALRLRLRRPAARGRAALRHRDRAADLLPRPRTTCACAPASPPPSRSTRWGSAAPRLSFRRRYSDRPYPRSRCGSSRRRAGELESVQSRADAGGNRIALACARASAVPQRASSAMLLHRPDRIQDRAADVLPRPRRRRAGSSAADACDRVRTLPLHAVNSHCALASPPRSAARGQAARLHPMHLQPLSMSRRRARNGRTQHRAILTNCAYGLTMLTAARACTKSIGCDRHDRPR
jgi:hypothetical protein